MPLELRSTRPRSWPPTDTPWRWRHRAWARNLNPIVTVADEEVVLDTAALGAVPARLLRKPITNLRGERGLIQDALDTVFGSF